MSHVVPDAPAADLADLYLVAGRVRAEDRRRDDGGHDSRPGGARQGSLQELTS